MTQNVSENLSYQLNDFISLKRVSEKIAKQFDDAPDLFLTLEQCIDVGISPLIWISRDVVVSRIGKLEDWHGALFLTGECVDELLNSRGDSIKVRRFWACAIGDMLRGLRRSDELWIDSWYEGDDWPCVEFDIEAVRILRTDLVKLNLVPDVVAELKPAPVLEVPNELEHDHLKKPSSSLKHRSRDKGEFAIELIKSAFTHEEIQTEGVVTVATLKNRVNGKVVEGYGVVDFDKSEKKFKSESTKLDVTERTVSNKIKKLVEDSGS